MSNQIEPSPRPRALTLDPFFSPRSVAVLGVNERPGSLGRLMLWNLLSQPFGGVVYPVHPHRRSVLGVACFPSLQALPEPVDLAVIAAPPERAALLVAECGEAGVSAAIVASDELSAVQNEAVRTAALEGRIRLLGPGSFGVIRPPTGLFATWASAPPQVGQIAVLTQSAAIGAALLDWGRREHVGFSALASVGGMLDVGWGELLDYLGNDPQTTSIVISMEQIGDPRAFISAAREATLSKPVVVLHSRYASAEAEVHAAIFRRCGVLQVSSVAELFNMAETLSGQPRPAGRRLMIVTNARGPGILAEDALLSSGGQLAGEDNPRDLGGQVTAEEYVRQAEAGATEPDADGLLAILAPEPASDPIRTADLLVQMQHPKDRPLLACWLGAPDGEAILNRAGIPTFAYPDDAVRAFQAMWRYGVQLRNLYETPQLPHNRPDSTRAAAIIAEALAQKQTELEPDQTRALLAAYGFPGSQSLSAAFELQLAILSSPEFGPVLRFGLGGKLAEAYADRIVTLPPLTTTLARQAIQQTRLGRALQSQLPPERLSDLDTLLVHLSWLAAEHPRIAQAQITLLADQTALATGDASVRLHPASLPDERLPRLAIRPYPSQYSGPWQLRSGEEVFIRPIRPEDEPLIIAFHRGLSEQTVFYRYFFPLTLDQRTAHERLIRICFNDYDREIALVVEHGEGEERQIIAVGRLIKLRFSDAAEFAIVISDAYQRGGLGSELLRRLVEIGRAEGVGRIIAEILPENEGMKRICRRLGFTLRSPFGEPAMAEMVL